MNRKGGTTQNAALVSRSHLRTEAQPSATLECLYSDRILHWQVLRALIQETGEELDVAEENQF